MTAENGDFFTNELGHRGTKAVVQLCTVGCERSTLLQMFVALATYKSQTRTSTGDPLRPLDGVLVRTEPHKFRVDPRSLDTRNSAHPGFTLKQIRTISRRARRLLDDVIELRRTPLVTELVDQGCLPEGDLLETAMSPFKLNESRHFFGLLNLPEFAKECGPQKRPMYTQSRHRIHSYIFEQTGSWNDSHFAAIYNDIFPKDQEAEKEVQRWRQRHKLPPPKIPK